MRLSYVGRLFNVLNPGLHHFGLQTAFNNAKVISKFLVNLKDGLPRQEKNRFIDYSAMIAAVLTSARLADTYTG